mgnify:CR=1 FL=1
MARPSIYSGPAVLSYGFRPFFFMGALYAGLSVLLWMPQYYGEVSLPTLMAPVDWHIHEMLFGFLSAVITGFLFTAVPNWTGRMPITGWPLLVLVVLWMAGRVAMTFSADIGWGAAMVIDVAFLVAVLGVIAVEIFAGKNWRNFRVLVPLALLIAANVGFHLEAHSQGITDVSRRAALAAAIILIMLIGGRIIPSFTRNWLAREAPDGRMPAAFGRFDAVALGISVLALALWVAVPLHILTGALAAFAAILQGIRLARWVGWRAVSDLMVFILHVGYGFLPIGFALIALGAGWPDQVPSAAATHALGAGAIGVMTMAVMVRATHGHTGHELKAGTAIKAIFACLLVSALVRIAHALGAPLPDVALHIAAFAWVIGFIGFAVYHAPMFFKASASTTS